MAPGCALKLGNQRKQNTAIGRLEAGRCEVPENYLDTYEPESIGRPAHLRNVDVTWVRWAQSDRAATIAPVER